MLLKTLSIALAIVAVSSQTVDLTAYSMSTKVTYNQTVKVQVGKTFTVVLNENPTTGYTW